MYPFIEGFNTNTAINPFILLTKPSGVVNGELLLIIIGVTDNLEPAVIDDLTGFTKYAYQNAADDLGFALFTREADGTEGVSETITISGGGGVIVGWYIRISGANSSNPIDFIGNVSETTASNIIPLNSDNSTVDKCLAFSLVISDGDEGVPYGTIGSNDWPTIMRSELARGTVAFGVSGGWMTKPMPNIGASGTNTINSNTSINNMAMPFGIAPALGAIPISWDYDSLVTIAKQIPISWDYDSLVTITKTLSLSKDYDSLVTIAKQLALSKDYDSLTTITKTLAQLKDYDTIIAITKTIALSKDYDSLILITKQFAISKDYDSLVTILKVVSTDYDTLVAVSKAIAITTDYDTLVTITKTAAISWNYDSLVTIDKGFQTGYTQEGFRFRNDDGSESAATWTQLQDTNHSISPSSKLRLRMIMVAMFLIGSRFLTLEYKRTDEGDSEWRTI